MYLVGDTVLETKKKSYYQPLCTFLCRHDDFNGSGRSVLGT